MRVLCSQSPYGIDLTLMNSHCWQAGLSSSDSRSNALPLPSPFLLEFSTPSLFLLEYHSLGHDLCYENRLVRSGRASEARDSSALDVVVQQRRGDMADLVRVCQHRLKYH